MHRSMGSNDPLDFVPFLEFLSPFILLKIFGEEDLEFFHWSLTPTRRFRSLLRSEHFRVISFPLSEQRRLLRAKFVSLSYFEYDGRVQGIREGTETWRGFFFTHRIPMSEVDYVGVIISSRSELNHSWFFFNLSLNEIDSRPKKNLYGDF